MLTNGPVRAFISAPYCKSAIVYAGTVGYSLALCKGNPSERGSSGTHSR